MAGTWDVRRRKLPACGMAFVGAFVTVAGLFCAVPASALQCFACDDCSVGGALSAQKQQCGSADTFCAAVFRRKHVRTMSYSTEHRGCASSLGVHCTLDGLSASGAAQDEQSLDHAVESSSPASYECCSTDLCNGWGDARIEGPRKSAEHFRDLMEGKPKRASGVPVHASGARAEGQGSDDNSGQSLRRSGGSRLATALVIVGTFSQVLWLVGNLVQ